MKTEKNKYKKLLVVLLALALFRFNANAQLETFSSTWGGISYDNDPTAVLHTDDQGYLACYSTANSSSGFNIGMQINKFNHSGEIEWSRHVQKSGSQFYGYSVIQSRDDGFVVIGELLQESIPFGKCFVLKLNKNGDLLWQSQLIRGTEQFDASAAYNVEEDHQGDLLICGYGYTKPDNESGLVVKMNDMGEVIWSKHYGSEKFNSNNSIRFWNMYTSLAGNIFISGDLSGYDINDEYQSRSFLARLDDNGNTQWVKSFAPVNDSLILSPTSINYINDTIYVNGILDFTAEEKDPTKGGSLPPVSAFSFSTDMNGNLFSSTMMRSNNSAVSSILQEGSRWYIFHTAESVRLTGLDLSKSGNETMWSKQYGDAKYADPIYGNFKSFDSGFIMLAMDASLDDKKNLKGLNVIFNHMVIADKNGNNACMKDVTPALEISSFDLLAETIIVDVDTSTVNNNRSLAEIIWDPIVPFDTSYCDLILSEGANKYPLKKPQIQFYPNPMKDRSTLKMTENEAIIDRVEIFDISGRRVKSMEGSGSNEVIINKENLSKGFYQIHVWSRQHQLGIIKAVIQ